MKKLFFMLVLFPALLSAQYYGERATEQSFEKSDLYFNSHYLNTFGLENFKNVAVGVIDDPFLNAYLNPAIIPKFNEKNTIFYLDFRGDRTVDKVVSSYIVPLYYAGVLYRPIYDRRWISITRAEPEPTFSFGFLANPIKEVLNNFYIGATYQMIRRKENFYTSPYYIYNPSYYYDALGMKAQGAADVPIKDRYSAKDEMITNAHLFSAFAGYSITDKLSLGLSFNGVVHKREGGYLEARSDEYGNTNNSDWESRNQRGKSQDYNHTDFSTGLMYQFSDKFNAGLKLGQLNGKVEQKYNYLNYYFYNYDATPTSNNWSNSYSNSSTVQSWNQDGTNKYFSLNFNYIVGEGKSFSGYYRYSKTKGDISNSSVIMDTSFYVSHYENTYNNVLNVYDYSGKSAARDIRSGRGNRNENNNEVTLRFSSELNSWCKLNVGLYINKRDYRINTTEPVTANRYSEYHSRSTGSYNYQYDRLLTLDEIKQLVWTYSSDYFTLQIPVILNFTITEKFGLTVGVNRMLKDWEINETTTAYFTSRKRNEDGVIKEEKNFGERYSPADEKYTDNETDMFLKLIANISKEFRVNLLVDPEFKNLLRVSQWWLSFEARF
ncbi:MAG: hypothetical protein AB1298_09205 [Bacteroidota bacterium]